MNEAVAGNSPARQALKEASLLILLFLLLFFRNSRIFLFPEPWAEDMAVFLRAEYVTGFPDTAFSLYAGYIHLLPRIIAWLSLKTGFEHAMYVMNWSVLLVKLLTCLLICRSKEIPSSPIKGAIIAYLVLMPFADEVYSNVTNLQWWLIPLMGVIIIHQEKSAASLTLSAVILVLTGLTGVNSVMFALPCAFLILKDRSPASIIKNSIVILCGAVQLYFLLSTGRGAAGSMAFEGGTADLICIFVKRVIFHTLFKSDTPLLLSIPVLGAFIALAALNLRRYRKLRAVQFIALFAAVYTAVIFYNLTKSEKDPSVLLTTFSGERYFVFLRLLTFVLIVSSLDLLFRSARLLGHYKKLMAVTFLVFAVLLARRYPVRFPSGSEYYADIAKFEAAKPGDTVTIHFPPDWKCDLRKK